MLKLSARARLGLWWQRGTCRVSRNVSANSAIVYPATLVSDSHDRSDSFYKMSFVPNNTQGQHAGFFNER